MSDDAALNEALFHLFDPNIRLPSRPLLVEDLDVFDMPEGMGIQFRGGDSPVVIRGTAAGGAWSYLESAMDGHTPVGDLLNSAPEGVGQLAVAKLLSLLHGKGLLQARSEWAPSSTDGALERQAMFWGRHLGITGSANSGNAVQRGLASARVLLVASGLFGLSIADLLTRSGVGHLAVVDLSPSGDVTADWTVAHRPPVTVADSVDTLGGILDDRVESMDLVVCATMGGPESWTSAVNRICCAARTRLLIARSSETRLDLGPLVQPGESACYECVRLREVSLNQSAMTNLLYQDHLEQNSDRPLTTIGEAIPVAALYAALVATEVVRVTTGIAPPTLLNHVTAVEGVRGRSTTNQVPRVPRCPVCSRASVHTSASGLA